MSSSVLGSSRFLFFHHRPLASLLSHVRYGSSMGSLPSAGSHFCSTSTNMPQDIGQKLALSRVAKCSQTGLRKRSLHTTGEPPQYPKVRAFGNEAEKSTADTTSALASQIYKKATRTENFASEPQAEPSARSEGDQQLNLKSANVRLQIDTKQFSWMKKIFEDLKQTWNVLFATRRFLLAFAAVLYVINRVYHLENNYLGTYFNTAKPTAAIAAWLEGFSRISMPKYPPHTELSTLYTVLGCRPVDWLQSPFSIITHFTNAFACLDINSVKSNCLILLAFVPLLRQVMSSRKIIIIYVLGGFLSSNFHCGLENLLNINASLPIDELQRRIDSVPFLQHNRAYRSQLWNDALGKLDTLAGELSTMIDTEMREQQKGSQEIKAEEGAGQRARVPPPLDQQPREDLKAGEEHIDSQPIEIEFEVDEVRQRLLAEFPSIGDEAEEKPKEITQPRTEEESPIETQPTEIKEPDTDADEAKTVPALKTKFENLKKELSDLQDTQRIFDYVGVGLGTSCAITCLSKPKSHFSFQDNHRNC